MVDFLRKICLPYFLLEFIGLFVRHKSHPLHNSTNVNHIEQKFRAHVQPALFKVQVTIVEQRSDNLSPQYLSNPLKDFEYLATNVNCHFGLEVVSDHLF